MTDRQRVLMFLIGCVHTKNYLWMNNSIFLRRGSNDRLPIPWHHAFQISVILQCFHSKMCGFMHMYMFYVYFSDMASHLLGNNMSTPMRQIHPRSYLSTTVHTFVVISSYVVKFTARLHKPNDGSGAFTKTSLLTRAWRQRSRPS